MRNNFPVQAWRNLQSQPNSPYFLFSSIDIQAQAHYNRVIADGGIIPAGLLGTNAWFVAVKAVYGVTDITTAISAGYDPHYLGAKIGAGSGTTLGQAATKLYSCSGASGDLTQATAASMPLLLVKNSTDANYYYSSGVAGNYCSTTTSKTFTNFTFNTKFNVNTQLAAASEIFGRDFVVRMNLAKTLDIYSSDAVISVTTTAFAYTDNTDFYIRITRVGTTLKVFSSTDGINYTQKDSDFTVGSGSITITNLNVAAFGASGAAFNPFGRIYYATIDGVVDFNPASYNAATSQTQWTSTTGEVWTINTGTAATGYKGVLVDRTILQGDGVDDAITTSAFAINQPNTSYSAFANYTNVGAYAVADGISGDSRNFYNIAAAPTQRGLYVSGAGAGVIYSTGFTLNKLELVVFGLNSSSTYAIRNNGSRVLGSVGTANCNGQRLFVGGNNYSNTLLTTHIITNSQDTPTQNTAMYNTIKSFNNNAF